MAAAQLLLALAACLALIAHGEGVQHGGARCNKLAQPLPTDPLPPATPCPAASAKASSWQRVDDEHTTADTPLPPEIPLWRRRSPFTAHRPPCPPPCLPRAQCDPELCVRCDVKRGRCLECAPSWSRRRNPYTVSKVPVYRDAKTGECTKW